MTPLERRCRWLLHAYPAAYLQMRGEEMLGTLLESTPGDRSWPLPREGLAMIAGGLQARAAQNRRLRTPANLRLAATLGCVLYLSYTFSYLAVGPLWRLGAWRGARMHLFYPQLAYASGLLFCAAVLVVRPAARKGVITTLVAVAALLAGTAADVLSHPIGGYVPITILVVPALASGLLSCAAVLVVRPAARKGVITAIVAVAALLAGTAAEFIGPVGGVIAITLLVVPALALLSRGADRMPGLWLVPPGLAVAAVMVLAPVAGALHVFDDVSVLAMNVYMWEAIVFLAIAWIVVDARPAGSVAVCLVLTASPLLPFGALRPIAWKVIAAALLLAVLSAWRLRRQSVL